MKRSLLLFLVCLAACGGTRVLDRAEDGTPILICGSQPSRASLEGLHRVHGVRTVLNLRSERPQEAWFLDEQRGVEAIGARWIHLPTSGHVAPSDEHLARFFAIVDDPDNWPIFMHCQSGIHRTGLMAAVYRMQYQGWTGEEALAEMRRNGFDLGRAKRTGAKAFVRGYTVPGSEPQ